MTVFDTLASYGVIPVVTIDQAQAAVPLGHALLAGGLGCAEITLRTPEALDALRAITAAHPSLLVGAGTVLTIPQAQQAIVAGADFLVSPGFAPDLVQWCHTNAVPLLPGVMTPTEIMQALAMNITCLKWFPAEASGGTSMLKALAAPFPMMKFIPTGGITPINLSAYLAIPSVAACGGSWITPPALMVETGFEEIRYLAQDAAALVRHARHSVNSYG